VTVSEEAVFVGSREDELLALDRANGALLWSFPQEGQEDDGLEGIYASPAVTDDLVLVGGYNGILYALDPSTRQKVWEFQTDDSIVGSPALVYEETREITPTPTPSAGSAFSVGAPTPTPSFGSAFSVGAPTPTPSDGSPSGQEAVASRLELIIVGSSDGNLYAMDTNGVEQWRFETGNKIWSMPVVYEDVVYFGSLDHNVYAVSLKDTGSLRAGDEMWRFETDGAVAATPLVMNGRVYIGSFDRRFYSLDAFSGQEAWAEPFEAENWFWSKAVSDGATVYVASLDGNLYALDSTSGAERWRFEAQSPIIAAPALVPSGVAVATDNGDIYLVRSTDGTEIRDFAARDHIRAPLTSSGSIVYFSAMNHTVRAVDLQQGFWTELWCFNTKESNRQCE
jgi:outer membrane protein assembly factor BamB